MNPPHQKGASCAADQNASKEFDFEAKSNWISLPRRA
jgi:hypothetical protein